MLGRLSRHTMAQTHPQTYEAIYADGVLTWAGGRHPSGPARLARRLGHYGCAVTRQSGSPMRLRRQAGDQQRNGSAMLPRG
jgi:hypothetical protein